MEQLVTSTNRFLLALLDHSARLRLFDAKIIVEHPARPANERVWKIEESVKAAHAQNEARVKDFNEWRAGCWLWNYDAIHHPGSRRTTGRCHASSINYSIWAWMEQQSCKSVNKFVSRRARAPLLGPLTACRDQSEASWGDKRTKKKFFFSRLIAFRYVPSRRRRVSCTWRFCLHENGPRKGSKWHFGPEGMFLAIWVGNARGRGGDNALGLISGFAAASWSSITPGSSPKRTKKVSKTLSPKINLLHRRTNKTNLWRHETERCSGVEHVGRPAPSRFRERKTTLMNEIWCGLKPSSFFSLLHYNLFERFQRKKIFHAYDEEKRVERRKRSKMSHSSGWLSCSIS